MSDPDVKKAIEAHRQKTVMANQQISVLNSQIESLNIKFRRSQLIESELVTLPEDVATYKACGRMFIKKTRETLIEDIKKDRDKVTDSIEISQKARDTVNNELSESKEALRELLSSKQS
ncbi:prefoldin subunit 1 [Schistosoma bovis]|uniref:Prefoldin subunit n=2 Tax=Schistosoma TaxID=6181 RepID=A0A183KPH5_9TREM|nr:prefoldin subunit 1 [Schistosoma bovis]VDP62544.1 unnamed protein product [Schistosoma curassoni]